MVCSQELDPFGIPYSFCCAGIWKIRSKKHIFSLTVSSVTILLAQSAQNEEFESVKNSHTGSFNKISIWLVIKC